MTSAVKCRRRVDDGQAAAVDGNRVAMVGVRVRAGPWIVSRTESPGSRCDHGAELLDQAGEHQAHLLCHVSVGGGCPAVAAAGPMSRSAGRSASVMVATPRSAGVRLAGPSSVGSDVSDEHVDEPALGRRPPGGPTLEQTWWRSRAQLGERPSGSRVRVQRLGGVVENPRKRERALADDYAQRLALGGSGWSSSSRTVSRGSSARTVPVPADRVAGARSGWTSAGRRCRRSSGCCRPRPRSGRRAWSRTSR